MHFNFLLLASLFLITACGQSSSTEIGDAARNEFAEVGNDNENEINRGPSKILEPTIPVPFAPPPTVEVGFSHQETDLPNGVSLAGFGGLSRRKLWGHKRYAKYFKPNEGQRDPIRAKAMVVKNKKGEYLVFVSYDVVFLGYHMVEDIAKHFSHLNVKKENIFVGATHSHSGPGGITDNHFLEFIASDAFNSIVYKSTMNSVYSAIQDAIDTMTESYLHTLNFEGKDLIKNRRNTALATDRQVNLLIAESTSGVYHGAMINFPIHGTAFGISHMKLSADILGALEHAVEKHLNMRNGGFGPRVTAMFMNGAEGDIKPAKGGEYGLKVLPEKLISQIKKHWDKKKTVSNDWSTFSYEVELGTARANFKNCVENKYIDKLPNRTMLINISRYMPKTVSVTGVKFGGRLMLAWPGEAISLLGLQLREVAKSKGFEDLMVLGLTNGYLGYFVSPEEYSKGGYEVCASFYGEKGGQRFVDGFSHYLAQDSAIQAR